MAEYINKQALLAEYDRVHVGPPGGARKLIEEAPAADVVPVVRCKDCKHFINLEPCDPCECMKWTVKWGRAYVEPNDFCSYGERKGGAEC